MRRWVRRAIPLLLLLAGCIPPGKALFPTDAPWDYGHDSLLKSSYPDQPSNRCHSSDTPHPCKK